MPSRTNRAGYLLIDHRNSPGAGKVAAGATFEADTATCSHCQFIVVLNPDRTRERAYCRQCDHYICDPCAATGACMPFAKKLEQFHERVVRGLPTEDLIPHG